ncbi:MAG TPA: hypothetical protein GX401_09280 [Clostridiales bacterium]|nr:hypothetical protein [Clostridiales bacterium]
MHSPVSIGGFHHGLRQIRGTWKMASDMDPITRKSYTKNHDLEPKGDIYDISSRESPDFDLLCGGFTCQPFSNIGYKD